MKIAVQMDHISTLNIESDTTLALCLEAQKREYLLFHYLPDDLVYEDGEIFAKVEPMIVTDNKKVRKRMKKIRWSLFIQQFLFLRKFQI